MPKAPIVVAVDGSQTANAAVAWAALAARSDSVPLRLVNSATLPALYGTTVVFTQSDFDMVHADGERILAEAEATSRAMKREAEEYVDGKLAQFEIGLRKILEDSQSASKALAKTLDQVEVGRDKLRAPSTAAEQEFGDHEARPPRETQLFDEEGS